MNRAVARLTRIVVVFAVVFIGATGVALGVIGGRAVPIRSAPWTVVVWERYVGGRYAACTGVIVDPLHVLTAGHCVMVGNSAKPLPASGFWIEAGVSNFKHLLKSERPQCRAVRAVRAMPGYVAASKETVSNEVDTVGHDLAVLTLSRALDLRGDDARAAHLPTSKTPKPWAAPVVMAGFGNERPKPGGAYATGALNELVKPTVVKGCSVGQVCVDTTSRTCWGDSGSGLVEPGSHPIVIGILSEDDKNCAPGWDYFAFLTAPASLSFITTGT
jgi:secreted trypsin-like serine protease